MVTTENGNIIDIEFIFLQRMVYMVNGKILFYGPFYRTKKKKNIMNEMASYKRTELCKQ